MVLEFLDKAGGYKSQFSYLESNEIYDRVFSIFLSSEGFCEQKLDFGCFSYFHFTLITLSKKKKTLPSRTSLPYFPAFALILLYLFALCFLSCSRVIEVFFLSSHPFLNTQMFGLDSQKEPTAQAYGDEGNPKLLCSLFNFCFLLFKFPQRFLCSSQSASSVSCPWIAA